MFPHQAVAAAIELKSKYFMPIHWGAFTLAMHPWDEPVKKSIELAEKIGLNCITPRIGVSFQDIQWINNLRHGGINTNCLI